MRMIARLHLFLMREEGQTMAEYGVVLAVITVLTVAVFIALSSGIRGTINSVISAMTP
jgi:Flp pilus assembly pilin Flp